jgi:hypothetical protein
MLGGQLMDIPGYSNVSYHMIKVVNKGDHSRTGVTSIIYKHSSWPPIWNGLQNSAASSTPYEKSHTLVAKQSVDTPTAKGHVK